MPLLDRQVAFVAALREAGVRVSVAEGLDAVRAFGGVDLLQREQLRAALAATLVKRQVQRPAFDTVFDLFYPAVRGTAVADPDDPPVPRDPRDRPHEDPARDRVRDSLAQFLADGDEQQLDVLVRDAVTAFGSVPGRTPGQTSWSRLAVLQRVSAETLMARLLAQLLAGQDRGDSPSDERAR